MHMLNPARSPILVSIASAALLVSLATWLNQFETLPDFSQHQDVQEKKAAFFNYLQPKVQAVNQRIRKDRKAVMALQTVAGDNLAWWQRARLVRIARRYGIDPDAEMSDHTLLAETLERANIVPTSLALIQAAKESGWGTSKFAKLANNLFGQQCFKPGCGIVPKARAAGRRHEVQRFTSVEDAIAAYAFNLNSHPRYAEMRQIRARLSATDQPITGTALAQGLLAYSERRGDYVKEIQAMIRQNKLE